MHPYKQEQILRLRHTRKLVGADLARGAVSERTRNADGSTMLTRPERVQPGGKPVTSGNGFACRRWSAFAAEPDVNTVFIRYIALSESCPCPRCGLLSAYMLMIHECYAKAKIFFFVSSVSPTRST